MMGPSAPNGPPVPIAMAAERGFKTAAGIRVDVSARELPARVGVRSEQVDEVLLKLLKTRIISVQPDAIVIADVARLRHFLEFLQMRAQFGDLA